MARRRPRDLGMRMACLPIAKNSALVHCAAGALSTAARIVGWYRQGQHDFARPEVIGFELRKAKAGPTGGVDFHGSRDARGSVARTAAAPRLLGICAHATPVAMNVAIAIVQTVAPHILCH